MRKTADLELMIEPVVRGLGCELWGVEQASQGQQTSLRVYIEAEQGVTLEHCEKVSRQLSSLFDVQDPIQGQYTLEVSSPGIDRKLFKLDQYAEFVGETLKLSLRSVFEGRKNFKGLLTAIEGDEVVIRIGDEEMLIPYEIIDRANLVPDFGRPRGSVH